MFIVNPLSGERMDNLFSTHPAPENRIAALEEIARSMGEQSEAPVAPATRVGRPWGSARRGPWG